MEFDENNFIDQVFNGQNADAKETFNNLMMSRVNDVFHDKKQELAARLFNNTNQDS